MTFCHACYRESWRPFPTRPLADIATDQPCFRHAPKMKLHPCPAVEFGGQPQARFEARQEYLDVVDRQANRTVCVVAWHGSLDATHEAALRIAAALNGAGGERCGCSSIDRTVLIHDALTDHRHVPCPRCRPQDCAAELLGASSTTPPGPLREAQRRLEEAAVAEERSRVAMHRELVEAPRLTAAWGAAKFERENAARALVALLDGKEG